MARRGGPGVVGRLTARATTSWPATAGTPRPTAPAGPRSSTSSGAGRPRRPGPGPGRPGSGHGPRSWPPPVRCAPVRPRRRAMAASVSPASTPTLISSRSAKLKAPGRHLRVRTMVTPWSATTVLSQRGLNPSPAATSATGTPRATASNAALTTSSDRGGRPGLASRRLTKPRERKYHAVVELGTPVSASTWRKPRPFTTASSASSSTARSAGSCQLRRTRSIRHLQTQEMSRRPLETAESIAVCDHRQRYSALHLSKPSFHLRISSAAILSKSGTKSIPGPTTPLATSPSAARLRPSAAPASTPTPPPGCPK